MIGIRSVTRWIFVVLMSPAVILFVPAACLSAVFCNFDDLPATVTNELPGSSTTWLYTTADVNPDNNYYMTIYDADGWRSTVGYPDNAGIHNFFYIYFNTYMSDHMGWPTYGYMGIDADSAVVGKCLRYDVTGGINSTGVYGSTITTKQDYLNYLSQGHDPVADGALVGSPYVYFCNNSSSYSPIPFPEASQANRLSVYIYAPPGLNNGVGGWGNPVTTTMNFGPFNGVGGHWYHNIYSRGGGWIHVLLDSHPQHNNAFHNASLYPYPSASIRDMGVDYYNTMSALYVVFMPYSGIDTVPYTVMYDEMEFYNDPEPQNNETIASPTVMYVPASKTFEIGLNDKYKGNSRSYSTYELRYSFSPITNANWAEAAPVRILADARFDIDERADGKFAKWWPYYQSVWAPFTLASDEDKARLLPGTRIYFAVRDISQVDGDGSTPVTDTGVGHWATGGRDYANYGDTFDYAGDQPVLKLIKRIDYIVPGGHPSPVTYETGYPVPPENLEVK